MSLLEQARGLSHVQGLPPGASSLIPPHPLEGPPNSDVLLALLARNKSLEGTFLLDLLYYDLHRLLI